MEATEMKFVFTDILKMHNRIYFITDPDEPLWVEVYTNDSLCHDEDLEHIFLESFTLKEVVELRNFLNMIIENSKINQDG